MLFNAHFATLATHTDTHSTTLLPHTKLDRMATEASAGAFSPRQCVDVALQGIGAILAHYDRRMDSAVAGYALPPAGREYVHLLRAPHEM